MPSAYLDASALVKLISTEAESRALRRHLQSCSRVLTSIVADIEVIRAARRSVPGGAAERAARTVLAGCDRVALGADVVEQAIVASPPELRALDAIHLASALRVGDAIDEFVTYDQRLARAARAAGLVVTSPGAPDQETSR